MTTPAFFEDGSRLLTPHAFDFVLEGELKRAVRSQNFLTLVVIEARREWDGLEVTANDATLEDVAQIVGREVRNTDLLGRTDRGLLSMVLLDADFDGAMNVVQRLAARVESHEFPTPLRISVGAACCPTHAVSADSLRQEALARPVATWRRGPASRLSTSGH
jgi:diguanylate cyclase (GGDEF)-like protein